MQARKPRNQRWFRGHVRKVCAKDAKRSGLWGALASGLLALDWLRPFEVVGCMADSKTCTRCGETKPVATGFYRYRNGDRMRVQSQCIDCLTEKARLRRYGPEREEFLAKRRAYYRRRKRDTEAIEKKRAYQREYERYRLRVDEDYANRRREASRRWKERNKDRQREYNRQKRIAIQSDPVRHAEELRKERERYAIRQDRRGVKRRVGRSELDRRRSTGLPIGPFREWLLEFREMNRDPDAAADKQYAGISAQIALVLGVAEAAADRAMYRWLHENQVIPLDVADAVLTHLDSPARLYELWPELAEGAAA